MALNTRHTDTPSSNIATAPSQPDHAIALTASLSGAQEVVAPGAPSPAQTVAKGSSKLVLNAAGNALEYSVTVSGIDFGALLGTGAMTPQTDDDLVFAHIHAGPRGVNAPVIFTLSEDGKTLGKTDDKDDLKIVRNADNSVTLTGIWEQTDNSKLSSIVDKIRDAKSGQDIDLYWNFHTTKFKGGEIRGQLQGEPTPPPSKPVTLTAALSGAQEVVAPGAPSPAQTAAKGTSKLVLNAAGDGLEYSVTVSGIDFGALLGTGAMTPQTDDDLVFAHIHAGPRGVNAPVIFTLSEDGKTLGKTDDKDDLKIVRNADNSVTFTGVWEQTDNGKLSNVVDKIRGAQPGQDIDLYWNFHTTKFKGGEIRGQLQGDSTPPAPVPQAVQPQGVVPPAPSPQKNSLIRGSKGNDKLLGTQANDIIRGLDGNDIIRGLGGNDRIDGGNGKNILFGNSGSDVFLLKKGKGVNIIKDFKAVDRLSLGNGMQLNELTLSQQGRNTLISTGQDVLAQLSGVTPKQIKKSSFI